MESTRLTSDPTRCQNKLHDGQGQRGFKAAKGPAASRSFIAEYIYSEEPPITSAKTRLFLADSPAAAGSVRWKIIARAKTGQKTTNRAVRSVEAARSIFLNSLGPKMIRTSLAWQESLSFSLLLTHMQWTRKTAARLLPRQKFTVEVENGTRGGY